MLLILLGFRVIGRAFDFSLNSCSPVDRVIVPVGVSSLFRGKRTVSNFSFLTSPHRFSSFWDQDSTNFIAARKKVKFTVAGWNSLLAPNLAGSLIIALLPKFFLTAEIAAFN